MKKNKKALSLAIAMGLTLVMAILTIYILEYMVPFARNTKGIEQSVGAYYQADSAIEDSLYSMKIHSGTLDYEKHKDFTVGELVDYEINMISSGYILPPVGKGNSEYDKNFNIIKVGEPIQIEIGYGMVDLNYFKFYFRVPDFDDNGSLDEVLGGSGSLEIINWQLASKTNALNASGSQIIVDQINGSSNSVKTGNNIFKAGGDNENGRDLNDNDISFSSYYNSYCSGTNSGCILKMSVVNELKLDTGDYIPYLEWNIDSGNKIPLRYRIIETAGRDYGFKKFLKIKIPQNTLNQAYDFTIFQ